MKVLLIVIIPCIINNIILYIMKYMELKQKENPKHFAKCSDFK